MNLLQPFTKLRGFFNMTNDIQVTMQYTPNPSAFKFLLSQNVKNEGTASYASPEECDNDLSKTLFKVPAVEHLYFFDNVITVTLNPSVPIDEVKNKIITAIKNVAPLHNADFETKVEVKKKAYDENTPPEIKTINEILDRTIRPGLQADGGDLEIVSYIHPELSVRYQGACGSCPSAFMGTLQAITHILREEFDPDIEIVPV